MCWVELAVVGTGESPVADGTVTGPWTCGAEVVKQHWTPGSRDCRLRRLWADQRPRPVGSCESKGSKWSRIKVEEMGVRFLRVRVYIDIHVRAQGGGRNSHGGRGTHGRVYLVWIWVGGNGCWLITVAGAVGQRRRICAHLVVRTMGEILGTRGHVDESSHPGRGAVNPFVLFKGTWLGLDVGQLSDGVAGCVRGPV